jgi:hypothetical protein
MNASIIFLLIQPDNRKPEDRFPYKNSLYRHFYIYIFEDETSDNV